MTTPRDAGADTDAPPALGRGLAPDHGRGESVYDTTIGVDPGITSKHRACAIGPDPPAPLLPIGPSPAALDALLDAGGGPDHVDVVLEPTGLGSAPASVYRRARSGGTGDELRDVDGQPVARSAASQLIRQRHPSKAARARASKEAKERKRAERIAAAHTRQPEGSSTGSRAPDPSAEYPTGGRGCEPDSGVGDGTGATDSACARLRS